MSNRSKAVSAARGAAKAAGGSHLTKQTRLATLTKLFCWLHFNGLQVSGVETLRGRHIAAFVDARKQEGLDVRTLQNEAAHIREAMRADGRVQAADSASISNKALGIAGGSRSGSKTAATIEQYQLALAKATLLDPGLAAALMLQRYLGLRAAEAVRSGPSLDTWMRQLSAGERVTITFGTKGGRVRHALPASSGLAREGIRAAQLVVDDRGGRLIDSPSLRQAMTWYRNQMHRQITPTIGIAGHSLRYAYARDRVAAYKAEGYSRKEALALTSIDLGHGDGRGRFVEDVYLQ